MYPYQYKVSLRCKHPSADPDEITKALGIQPDGIQKVGQPRTTPVGTPLTGLYKRTYWHAYLSGNKPQNSEEAEFETCLFQIAEQLEPSKDVIRAFVESGGEATLSVGLFCPQNSGMEFPWKLITRLASLRVGLLLDYYPGDPDSTS